MVGKRELGSAVAPYIHGLLAEKRSLGFLYETEELVLARFDEHCSKHGLSGPAITREFLGEWLERSATEGASSHARRVGVVRQLMLYMASMGLDVHVPGELPRADAKLPAGRYFVQDLIGLPVKSDEGAQLGTLSEVLDLPQGQVYVVKGEREILIPDVPEFILNIDPETGITVHLIEGM